LEDGIYSESSKQPYYGATCKIHVTSIQPAMAFKL